MSRVSNASTSSAGVDDVPEPVRAAIVQALAGMRFGQVTVIVHEGRVIQIDRTERRRFETEECKPS